MADANVESLKNLRRISASLASSSPRCPSCCSTTNAISRTLLSSEELAKLINPEGKWEAFEAVAVAGEGVFETLKAITS